MPREHTGDSVAPDVEKNQDGEIGGREEQAGTRVNIVNNVWWNTFFLWMIFANTVSMALYRPTEPDDSSHNQALQTLETWFLVIFTVEVTAKLVILNVSFFADGWNIMDLIIVSTGFLIFLDSVNTSVFRTIRVLRPLRSLGMMPGIRILIDALILSLPGLTSVLLLILFVFTILGVIGVQLFGGSLSHHCVPALHCVPENSTAAVEYLQYGHCDLDEGCGTGTAGSLDYNEVESCLAAPVPTSVPISLISTGSFGFCRAGSDQYACDVGQSCVSVTEPLHHGATNWDNILGAFVILFQLCTTEGWTTVMIPTLDTNHPVAVYTYFILALLMTSFFLANFVVAQMVVAFERAVEAQTHRPPQKTATAILGRWIKIHVCRNTDLLHDDIWQMRAAFDKLDTEEDGYLDADKVAQLSHNLDMEIKLGEMNGNGNGAISYGEFERWWKMRKAFDRADSEQNRSLTITEAEALAASLGVNIHVANMDVSGNNRVEYKEFVAWWNMRSQFDCFDYAHDGYLQIAEVEKLADELQLPQQFVDVFLAKGDANDDGSYSFVEFSIWWQLHHVFTKHKSVSGSLNAEQMQAFSASLGLSISVRDVSNNTDVSFEELLAWWGNTGRDTKVALMMASASEAGAEHPVALKELVLGATFGNLVIAVVLLNFIVLAYDHHNIEQTELQAIENCNMIFTFFFMLELLIKLVALGLGEYFSDRFNVLDFFIVLISVVELVSTDQGALSAMRTLRLLRVLRSLRIFSTVGSMRRLIEATMRGGQAIIDFGILLTCFIVIYALVGLHMFGDDLSSPMFSCPGRFDSFYYAVITVFQVLTRENWHELLYVGFNNYGATAFVYFASLIIVANYMVLSLFLGNMLHNLHAVFLAEAKSLSRAAKEKGVSATKRVPGQRFIKDKLSESEKLQVRSILAFQTVKLTPDMALADKEKAAALIIQRAWFARVGLLEYDTRPVLVLRTLGVFEESNAIRAGCLSVMRNVAFNASMLLVILASSMVLALEPPGDAFSPEANNYNAVDTAVAAIFSIEMMMAVIAFGFTGAETAYLRDGWNILDGFVVVISLICLIPNSHQYRILRVIRMFRVVRVLRGLRWMPGLHKITGAMIRSFVPICVVGAIALFSSSIFGVALIGSLKGKFYSCDSGNNARAHTYLSYAECAETGGQWVNADQNFDNYFAALLTMFELTTMEDWQSVMYCAIDTTDTVAHKNTYERAYRGNPYIAVMFIAFMLVGSFFFLNLFLGVVTSGMEMHEASKDATNDKNLDRAESHVFKVISVQPISSGGAWFLAVRQPCMDAVATSLWDVAVASGIVLNVAAMACETAGQGKWMDDVQVSLNMFFTIFFTVELGIKLIALHPRRCFRDRWNVLDFVIVILSWVEFAMDAIGSNQVAVQPTVFRTFRIFRLTRLLKLVPHSDGLQLIFKTFIEAIPMLATVGVLISLTLFVYTVLCVQLFGHIEPSQQEMNEIINFSSFWRACFTLCVMATGEHWNAIMHELRAADDSPGDVWVVGVFVTFQFTCVFLVFNLFVSVVVVAVQQEDRSRFEDQRRRELSGEPVTERDLDWAHVDHFAKQWMKLDSSGSGFLSSPDKLQDLFSHLGFPLCRGVDVDTRLVHEMGQPPYEFTEVLHLLVVRSFELDALMAAKALKRAGHTRRRQTSLQLSASPDLDATKFVNPMLDSDDADME